ncbi:unnamed protein product [Angiostrongylus costaricensis]|uniref:Dopey_N domain-containing protein n=1 Tax=Angiostrongylus costaricensis TaxID=334426 RepID=A0A0R3PCC6_ANGCS|nr:unnamed protein product [Angiostrongylus costaricensis]
MSLSSAGFSPGDVTTPNPLHNTSKYKVYVQAVDRALKTFENPNEWADLISALAKLTKVFQSNAKFGDIPKPVTVAKRLSQCLHPALPMGVHLKALETYRQIFDILGPQSLPKLLYLFAVGLFPLMDHCGIKVKSELFNIFEQYLLPLGQNLRPALPGFLAGVLLGLEEGTEFYERSLSVLDQVCEGVGERAFFACLWQAVLDSPSVRLPAMLYVNAKFDKTRTLDDQIAIVGDHVNHMVAALCATANDSGSPLVQRNLLDFLCSAFPLDSTNLTREDFVQLIMRCMFVVLRRDMSLNRRLYTWLMNPTALPLIVDALTEYLKLDIVEIPQSSTNAWAYGWGDKRKHVEGTVKRNHLRLSLDLKRDPFCLPYTGLEADKTNEKRRLDEISKTFNLLLNSLEQGFLFEFLGSWFTKLLDTVEPNSNDISQFSKVIQKLTIHSLATNMETFSLITPTHSRDLGLILSTEAFRIVLLLGQVFMESCLMECLTLLSSVSSMYCTTRSSVHLPLFTAVCSLTSQFVDYPLYCVTIEHQSNPQLPNWLNEILKVRYVQIPKFDFYGVDASDLSARITAFDLVLSIYLKCSSVISQHEAISGRLAEGYENDEILPTTVLLKPLLFTAQLNQLEKERVFERCGQAIWLAVGSLRCAEEHEGLSRLMALLHSRKPNEPSSDMENIVVSALTSTDPTISTQAAQTFHRIAVMLLLGVLADESVSRARTELKSAAAAWFIDCAKHNDLPRIVQMLATMLMNPVTARISIQYVWQEARLSKEQFSSMPPDVSVVTLVTLDGKQRLYHFDGPVPTDCTWLYELRNRLLLSSETGASEAEPGALSTCAAVVGGDIPNFDEDTVRGLIHLITRITELFFLKDSLDTLSISMEGVDVTVMETIQYMIECTVEEEESELDNRQRLESALVSAPPEGSTVVFRSDGESEVEPSAVSSRSTHESSERPAAFVSDGLSRHAVPNVLIIDDLIVLSSYKFKKGHRRQDSLQESIFSMTERELKFVFIFVAFIYIVVEVTFDTTELLRASIESASEGVSLFHESHVHMLLYGESGRVVDLGRSETAFRILTALLCPRGSPVSNRMLLSCLVSSGTAAQNGDNSGSNSLLTVSLVDLMAKHVRAILGQHFWSVTGDEDISKHRHLTLLELLITISLHFLRSFFLNSPICPVTQSDLVMAWKCKVHLDIAALDFLSELLGELCEMICRSYKDVYYIYFSPLFTTRGRVLIQDRHLFPKSQFIRKCRKHFRMPLSVSIFEFNEGRSSSTGRHLAGLLSAYNRSLLSVTAQAIRLESDVKNAYSTFGDIVSFHPSCVVNRLVAQQIYNTPSHRGTLREPSPALVELRAFLLIVLSALKTNPERHEMWFQFVVQILPWMERSLATVMVRVVEQLCKNVETALSICFPGVVDSEVAIGSKELEQDYPACFITMTLETITTLVHFCVVDTTAAGSAIHPAAPIVAGNSAGSMVGQVNVPSFQHKSNAPLLKSARNDLDAYHLIPLLTGKYAMAVIPGTKGATELFSNLVKVFSFSDSTSVWVNHWLPFLTYLIWKCFYLYYNKFIQTGGTNLAKLEGTRGSVALRQARNDMLTSLPHALATICDVWTVVRSNSTPCLPLGPPQHFRRLVLDLLSPIAQHHQQAFLTALSLVWLTRSGNGATSQRKMDPDRLNFHYTPAQHDISNLLLSIKVISFEELLSAVSDTLKEVGVKVTKLGVGEKNLAELVDSVCKSDDKERLLPTLQAVWGNVIPYLRAKNARNSRFFLASSQLLASMSSFSYMRPIWKKTTLELLLDSSFFKMDMQSLKQWLIVSDHLMTHDKTSFKDLLKSIAYTPNASFSIMTSKEQEYEARALAVKRLAFVVLGSELDQYQAQMNDIQGYGKRLSENLRVSQSPSIRSAVFLCIRVLLLRLRPPSLIGIWPIMITELVHVLLQMEQQLCSEGNGIEDLGCARDDAWMQLYLAACKTLETLCTLPAGYLAQFQMCHWAFVNSVSTSKTDVFLPFAGRINKLLRTKVWRFFIPNWITFLQKCGATSGTRSLCRFRRTLAALECKTLRMVFTQFQSDGQWVLQRVSMVDDSNPMRLAKKAWNHIGEFTRQEAIELRIDDFNVHTCNPEDTKLRRRAKPQIEDFDKPIEKRKAPASGTLSGKDDGSATSCSFGDTMTNFLSGVSDHFDADNDFELDQSDVGCTDFTIGPNENLVKFISEFGHGNKPIEASQYSYASPMVGSCPEVVADALLTLFFLFGPPKSAKLDAAYRGGTPMELFFAKPRSVETSRKRRADLTLRDDDMQSDTYINNSYGQFVYSGIQRYFHRHLIL